MNFDLHRGSGNATLPHSTCSQSIQRSESLLASYVNLSTAMGEKKIVGILPNYYVHVLDLVSLWMG